MATYVTSLDRNAQLAHLRTGRAAWCGTGFMGDTAVSDTIPADRRVCDRCVVVALARGALTSDEAKALLAHQPPVRRRRGGGFPQQDIAEVVALFREGLTDKEVAQRLGIGLRTVVRRASQGMAEYGAATRFQWAYLSASDY